MINDVSEIEGLLPKFKDESRRELQTVNYYGYRIVQITLDFNDKHRLQVLRKQYVHEWHENKPDEADLRQEILVELCEQLKEQALSEGREILGSDSSI